MNATTPIQSFQWATVAYTIKTCPFCKGHEDRRIHKAEEAESEANVEAKKALKSGKSSVLRFKWVARKRSDGSNECIIEQCKSCARLEWTRRAETSKRMEVEASTKDAGLEPIPPRFITERRDVHRVTGHTTITATEQAEDGTIYDFGKRGGLHELGCRTHWVNHPAKVLLDDNGVKEAEEWHAFREQHEKLRSNGNRVLGSKKASVKTVESRPPPAHISDGEDDEV